MAAPPITERHKHHFHKGAPIREPVRVATTANITVASALNVGDVIDGVTLVDLDRVLVWQNTAAEQNGIIVAGATPARAYDMSLVGDAIAGTLIEVLEGATYGGHTFRCLNETEPGYGADDILFEDLGTGGGGALDDLTDVTITGVADGEVLTYDSGSGDWVNAAPTGGGGGGGTFMGVRVRAVADVALTAATVVYLDFDTEDYDTDGFHTGGSPKRLTVPTGGAGKYAITAASFTTSSPGDGYCAVRLNGSTIIASGSYWGGGNVGAMTVATEYDLAVGDYIEFGIRVANSSKSAIDAGVTDPFFAMHRIASGGLTSARAKRTSGNITLNSTSWANVDTGLDLVVTAAIGNILQISFGGLIGNQATSLGIDAVTLVSGSPVNSVSGSGPGDYGFAYGAQSAEAFLSGHIQYAVVSGDISGGNVTLRLRYKTSSATNRTLYAGTGGNPQFNWSVVNLG